MLRPVKRFWYRSWTCPLKRQDLNFSTISTFIHIVNVIANDQMCRTHKILLRQSSRSLFSSAWSLIFGNLSRIFGKSARLFSFPKKCTFLECDITWNYKIYHNKSDRHVLRQVPAEDSQFTNLQKVFWIFIGYKNLNFAKF